MPRGGYPRTALNRCPDSVCCLLVTKLYFEHLMGLQLVSEIMSIQSLHEEQSEADQELASPLSRAQNLYATCVLHHMHGILQVDDGFASCSHPNLSNEQTLSKPGTLSDGLEIWMVSKVL